MNYDLYLKCCQYDLTVPAVYRRRILRAIDSEERKDFHINEERKWKFVALPSDYFKEISDNLPCCWLLSHFDQNRKNTEAYALMVVRELLWMLQFIELPNLSEIQVALDDPNQEYDYSYTYDDLYLDLLSRALSIQETSVFSMGSYPYITEILAHGRNLHSEDLIRFLKYNQYDHKLKSRLSFETIYHLIDSAGYETMESQNHIHSNLKFIHIDTPMLTQIVLEQYDRWISEKYPDAKKMSVDDDRNPLLVLYKADTDKYRSFFVERETLSASCFNLRLIGVERFDEKEIPLSELEVEFNDKKGKISIQRVSAENNQENDSQKESLEIQFTYTAYGEDQFSTYLEDISDIINLGVDTEEVITYKQGRFDLVYLFGEDIYDLNEHREIYFNREFIIDHSKSEKMIIRKNPDGDFNLPDDFFGEKIDAIHALIGRNGSGKSSLLDLLCSCEVFGAKGFSESAGKYFLIFKIDDTYYYITNTERVPELDFADNDAYIFEEGSNIITGEVTLCRISNIFELYERQHMNLKNSRILDLRTQYMMQLPNQAMNSERLLLENYQKLIQSKSDRKSCDAFNNKILPDFSQDNQEIYLSSGERARLSLFARILSVFCVHKDLQDKLRKPQSTPYYIFLIDEAELYFHPAWQRELIFDLRNFFQKIAELTTSDYVGFRGVTLILTSNSPFYMSDLPECMIHKLSTNGNSDEFHGKSFGQNIYSILRDKFFMENGVIGKFAYEKLEDVMKVLKDSDHTDAQQTIADTFLVPIKDDTSLTPERKEKIKFILEILGDPLMKEILEQMLERKESRENVSY